MTDAGTVAAAVDRLIQTYGSLDILFNNAGPMPAADIESRKTTSGTAWST